VPELRLARGPVDGLTVHYVAAGRGPAVLLVHGLGGFAESWRWNMDALAERARVYALDLPGFGQSAKPSAHYDLDFFAAAIDAFLHAMRIGPVSLVGHSLGGAVAVRYALGHPARVDRLALIAALVPGFYRLSLAYRLGALAGLGDAAALVRCAPLYRVAIARCFHAPRRADVDFLVDWASAARTGLDARLAFLRTLRHLRPDLVERAAAFRRSVAALDFPVLLVHGRQDPVIPPQYCDGAAGTFARASVRWLDACGHFPQIEHASRVNEWLAEFLVGRPAPR
jgi:pyruvate dehydrogenase E2 component (dihydrolipoamide acetyltransferase)